ncbi:aryl-alcohol dehydrogenase-like predicted oxidoreductase [Paraburkholderia silvatlantica]|uniref:Aryl-alcohol dehydrogenase-like predicted oxidoreductase n=1 Tax=Paraburkholderia silvatlantica TaxID=321895 RepID=A0A2V4TY57_9BURK|nr:aldo/keto reductase [Paraburkholderia silvatlantica]PYE23113.1 aryl-alcohol dehydrogenase-like predicted oxidoreductase [Paraburkholderia silvatlantica]
MQYATLGNTGALVSRLCLGTMTFGAEVSAAQPIGGVDREQVDRILGRAMDAGINFLDTADVYGSGASETVLGEVMGSRRDHWVIATKFNGRMGSGVNDVGQSRLHLHRALDASLRRLRTDYVDLYQVHNFDPITPLEETLRALDDVVRAGKVRYIGCSNYAAWQLLKALGISERNGFSRFATVQSFYSLVGRDVERELLPAIESERVGLLCWSPLAGGLLSGHVDRQSAPAPGTRRAHVAFPPVNEDRVFGAVAVLREIALQRATTVPSIAVAWLLSRPGVCSVICGLSKEAHLDSHLAAIDLELDDEELDRLSRATQAPASYPGWIQTYRASGRTPEGFPQCRPSWGPGETPLEPWPH